MAKGARTTAAKCAIGVLKAMLCGFNLVILISGIVMVAVCAWIIMDSSGFRGLLATKNMERAFHSIYIILGVGGALILIALMGCYGAFRENRCMIAFYFFLIFTVFVVELAGGIIAFVFYPEVKQAALDTSSSYGIQVADPTQFNSLPQSDQDLATDMTEYWDMIQSTFSCCGFSEIQDWNNSTFYKWSNKYPSSCCGVDGFEDIMNIDATPEQNQQAVLEKSCSLSNVTAWTEGQSCEQKAKTNIYTVGGISLGIVVIELLSMFASCCMFRTLDEGY